MASNADIISTAKSLEGKLTYVMGGDNIAGGRGDCSDFTQYVFRENGIEIGGYTEAQWNAENGMRVEKSALLPGDVVFFKNTYNSGYTDGVSHVGIYLGDSSFIHLGNSGCVISDLTSDYYKSHYLGAMRYDGVTYTDAEGAAHVESTNPFSTGGNGAGLKWWGDVVKVVLIIIICVAAVVLAASAVGINIKQNIVKAVV